MDYFNPIASIKRARNINRIIMVGGYIIANIVWVLWLNQVFGTEDNSQSGNIDGLVYLPALFATPIIALLFVPPFVWIGGVWQSIKLNNNRVESSIAIWIHTQPIINLILSPIALLACFVAFVLGSLFTAA